MKIDSASAKPVSSVSARTAPGRPDTGAAGGSTGDKVSLSLQASQLQELAASIAAAPAIDAARVEQIKQAIAQSRFSVDSHAVADRLLATARELLHLGNG